MNARHPDAFLFELRAACDEAFTVAPCDDNPIVSLLAGTMTREDALAFFANRWDQVLLRNEVTTARLIEHCPDIHGRADIWRVIFPEWGKGRFKKAEPALYQALLGALGAVRLEEDPALDRTKPEIRTAIAKLDGMCFFELLGWSIAHEVVAPKVFPRITTALAGTFGLDAEALGFFTSRVTTDVEHAEILFALAARFATNAASQAQVLASLREYFAADPTLCCALGTLTYSCVQRSHSLAFGGGWRRGAGAAARKTERQGQLITFDCYGTLIDWEQGVAEAFAEAASHDAQKIDTARAVAIFKTVDARLKRESFRSYRELLIESARITGEELGWSIPRDQVAFLADSVADWQPFADVVPALQRLSDAGYRLGVLSNVDDDLIEATLKRLEVPFEFVVTSERLRSYKPAPPHFTTAKKRAAGTPWLHVARSLTADIEPARAHGIPVAWVHRGDEASLAAPEGCERFASLGELVSWLETSAIPKAA